MGIVYCTIYSQQRLCKKLGYYIDNYTLTLLFQKDIYSNLTTIKGVINVRRYHDYKQIVIKVIHTNTRGHLSVSLIQLSNEMQNVAFR